MTTLLFDRTALADSYARDGFVHVPDLLTSAEVQALRDETTAICTGARGPIIGQLAANEDDGPDELLGRVLAVHFPHKASDAMRRALTHPRIVEVLTALVGPNVKAMQSMLFVKAAGKPGQAWHQDETYIPTRDRSLIGAWIALEDATVENGCLWMQPGSHRAGVLYPMKPHGDPRFDGSEEAHSFPYEREGGVPVEVKAGGVAFFNGYTLHRSLNNTRTHGFRRALVNHYMSAESLLPWSIMGPGRGDYRDIVLVAGEDPYAWKGLEDLTFPFVRPEDPTQVPAIYAEVRAEHDRRQAAKKAAARG